MLQRPPTPPTPPTSVPRLCNELRKGSYNALASSMYFTELAKDGMLPFVAIQVQTGQTRTNHQPYSPHYTWMAAKASSLNKSRTFSWYQWESGLSPSMYMTSVLHQP